MGILSGGLAVDMGKNAVNLGSMINVCATNAIARVMVGKRVVGESGDEKAEEFKAMVVELMVLAGVFNIGDFIPILQGFDLQRVASRMNNLHNRFDVFLNKILQHHNTLPPINAPVPDLLTTLISLKDTTSTNSHGGRLTDAEIKALLLVCMYVLIC